MRGGQSASPYILDAGAHDIGAAIEKMSGKRVFFDGVFKGDYSLAIVNRHLAQALIRTGVELVCHSPEEDWQTDARLDAMPDIRRRMLHSYPAGETFDIHLRNSWPPTTHDMVGRFNAYVGFAWEEMEVPAYLVERFNRDLDLVMVTANFVKEAFRRSGLTIPVEVIGNGTDHIDPDALLPPSPLPSTERQRILHVSSCFPRKGIDVLIEAFVKTFRRDEAVELVVKTFPNPDNILPAVMAKAADGLQGAAPVTIIETSYEPAQLQALYKTAALVVAPSRGEGFGLPLAEAMRLGVPVVTTDYSGQVDFCSNETAWMVDYHMSPSKAHVSGSLSLWAEPSVDDLGMQMRAALGNPDEARERSRKAQRLLAEYMTWRDVARRVIVALSRPASIAAAPTQPWTIDLVSSWRQQCGIATYAGHLFSQPSLAGRFSHIHARRILNDALPAGAEETGAADPGLSRSWGYDLTSLMHLLADLDRSRGDVFWLQHHPGHFSTPDMELMLKPLRHTRHRLRIVTMHSVKESLRGGSLEWTKAFDIAFVHSAEDAGLLARSGHPNPVAIPHGVLQAPPEASKPDGETFTVGSFGFLVPHKNLDILVQGFAKARLYEPRLRLNLLNCVVPSEESRASRSVVESLLSHFGLQDVASARFDFIGDDALRQELSRCDLLAFPYGASTESATGAARIAMSVDRPLLCSRSTVLRDMWPISHVLRAVDIDCIAEALVSLCQSPALLGLRDVDRRQAAAWNSYPRVAARHAVIIEQMLDQDYDDRRAA